MTPEFTDSRRAVLRALADNLVPALRRDADPSGFWAASGSALGADAGVAQALAALPAGAAATVCWRCSTACTCSASRPHRSARASSCCATCR